MINEQKNIFRQTSLDKISSPEKLNDYIKVSHPAVWVILAAIAIFLVGAVIWGFTYELTPEGLRPIEFLLGRG